MKELLWLVWQNPKSRKKYHVGNLLYVADDGYYFEYDKTNKPRGLQEAIKNGFVTFFAFPDLSKSYYSPFMFHAFSRRLPNKERPDYNSLLQLYGLTSLSHEMEILRVTKGKTATDSFELVSPLLMNEGMFKVDFYIEGWRYYDGEKSLDTLENDQELILVREPDLKHDKYAVKILTTDGAHLGYIPAVYAEFFSTLLKEDQFVRMTIKAINKHGIPQMKVLVHVTGVLPLNLREKYPNLLFPTQHNLEYT
ncbi:HIRAN domain-containing protein [Halobacillus amylolyticus]|uniref:HIRAN domain-containing protein n=1 Tax=Halobacillus amylolyticus TaxID=2932259 RepID=A0ABY4H736_9BACI|nr:HIRAN domain-containing protein [Halobacillus amylolyticus]UOR10258.1 HIRAN domain-containing protein [Halobacillus amylolyticus]